MLLRLLLFFFLACVLILLLKSLLSGGKKPSVRRNGAELNGEEMVLDPQCKSYLPKGDAIVRAGNYFCSQECADRYLSR